MKKILLVIGMLAVASLSGCVDSGDATRFCLAHSYDGWDRGDLDFYTGGYCYKINDDASVEKAQIEIIDGEYVFS